MLSLLSYQEYEGVYDHECDPEAVEVVVEALVQMSQSLKICLHATPVSGTGYDRQEGEGSVDEHPGLSAVEVHHNGDDADDADDDDARW